MAATKFYNDTTDHQEGHAVPHPFPIVYGIAFLSLMGLLILTVVMYYVDLSVAWHWVGWNVIVALIIACIKAAVVVLFFMNVVKGTKLTWLWAALGFIWLLLMSGVFMDYNTRAWQAPSGWTP